MHGFLCCLCLNVWANVNIYHFMSGVHDNSHAYLKRFWCFINLWWSHLSRSELCIVFKYIPKLDEVESPTWERRGLEGMWPALWPDVGRLHMCMVFGVWCHIWSWLLTNPITINFHSEIKLFNNKGNACERMWQSFCGLLPVWTRKSS